MDRDYKILIVDDEKDLVSNLQDVLEAEGYPSLAAYDGQTAISLCQQNHVDLAVIDIKLPDIPGEELINRLGEIIPQAEFIFITGYASLASAIGAVGRRDVVSYETKPLDIEHLLNLIRQVAERKRTEELLLFSDAAFKSIQESVIATDIDQKITRWNKVSEEIYGIKASEAIGKKVYDVIEIVETRNDEAEYPGASSKTHGTYQKEQLHRTRNAEVWVSVSVQPIESGDKRYGWVWLATDITQRRQAEELYRTLAESSPVGLYIAQDGRLQFVNPQFQKHTGYTEDELLGTKPLDLVHSEDRKSVRKNALGMLKGKRTTPYEFRITTKTGETLWAMETVISIIYKGKRATLSNFMDITERRRMEEQLIVADRLASIGELSSGIAHELNNPLTSVIGFSDLLLEKDIPDSIREDLNVINKEAKRTASVVKNLLTFARRHPQEKKEVDINQVITNVLNIRAYEQKVNNIQVHSCFAPDLPQVVADAFQLQQVFLNIIINAEYFMAEAHHKGNLTITTGRAGDAVRAVFADDGTGIKKETLGHLFDPFFTTKEVGKGTGLGLSICYGIVAEHSGRIYAESEYGEGATFTVELPLDRK